MRLALYQPDIPQNTGTLMRVGACFGVPVDIIEPCGFALDDRRMRRAAMDYGPACVLERHASWDAFLNAHKSRHCRLILLTTKGTISHTAFAYRQGDTLLLGRETAGVPDQVVASATATVRIPIAAGLRSLNVAVAGAIALAEALRQTEFFDYKQQVI